MTVEWLEIRPSGSGGKRRTYPATARIDESGALVLSAATMALLGDARRIKVLVEPQSVRFRILPLEGDDESGWTVAGGGHTPHRVKIRRITKCYPQLVGDYTVVRHGTGIELRRKKGDEINA